MKQMAIKSKLQARFCEALIEQRKLKGWNQTELARRGGFSQPEISDMENGKNEPTLRTIERLAAALKIKPEELFLLDVAHA